MKYLLITIIICTGLLGKAQNYNWTIYDTTNSPLQCNQVDELAVDKDNNIWMAACSSIYKLSNGNWTVYDTTDIGTAFNHVTDIVVDTNNIKWVGTLFNGLLKYDNATWAYYDTLNSNIPENYVEALAVDHDNLLWAHFDIPIPTKIYAFDGMIWNEYNQDTAAILVNAEISDIAVDNENTKYFASKGLYKYDNSEWTWEFIYYDFNNQIGWLRCVSALSPNDYWLSLEGTIRHYDANGYTEYDQSNAGISLHGIGSIAFDSTGNVWAGGAPNGLIRFDGVNWTDFTPSNSPFPTNQVGGPGSPILDIVVDHENVVYVGTGDAGLVVLEEQPISVTAPNINSFNVFPNPANDFVQLSYDQGIVNDKLTADLIDMNGRVIKSFHLQEGKNKHQISLEGISPGAYYLKIYTSETIVHKMIIKN